MRLLIDSLIAIMLIGVLAGVLLHHRQGQQEIERYRRVHDALALLHEQALFRSALSEAGGGMRQYPEELDRRWFVAGPPANPFAPDRPWIDVAAEGDLQDHPPDPVLTHPDQAGFWYSPARRVFRARVPAQATVAETLRLYNRVNGTALLALPRDQDERTPQRPAWAGVRLRPATATGSAVVVVEEPEPIRDPAPRGRRTLVDLPR
jgi:hypothetical protein